MLPKIIWRYWETGWDTTKWPLELCSQSVKHYASDWDIRDLDGETVKQYIDLPDEIWNYPVQVRSDLIRILLLEKYGGCWIDATIFLNTNFSDFIIPRCKDFFCFWRWENKTTVSNWFLAAEEKSYIAHTYSKVFSEYILSEKFRSSNVKYFNKWNGSPNYFCFHRQFEAYIKMDAEFKKYVDEMPFESSVPIMLPIMNDYCKPLPKEYLPFVLNETPMFKFSHRRSESECKKNSIIPLLVMKLNGKLEKYFLECAFSLPVTAMGQRSSFLYNSFLNTPEHCKEWTGVFDSESDMELSDNPTSKYHVFNFSSHDYKNNCQILIPYGQNKIFFRKQNGNRFDVPQELIFKSEFDAYKDSITKEIEKLRSETKPNQTKPNQTKPNQTSLLRLLKKSVKKMIRGK